MLYSVDSAKHSQRVYESRIRQCFEARGFSAQEHRSGRLHSYPRGGCMEVINRMWALSRFHRIDAKGYRVATLVKQSYELSRDLVQCLDRERRGNYGLASCISWSASRFNTTLLVSMQDYAMSGIEDLRRVLNGRRDEAYQIHITPSMRKLNRLSRACVSQTLREGSHFSAVVVLSRGENSSRLFPRHRKLNHVADCKVTTSNKHHQSLT